MNYRRFWYLVIVIGASLILFGATNAGATAPHNGVNLAGAEYGGLQTDEVGNTVIQPNVVGASATMMLPSATGTGWAAPWVGIGDGPGSGLVQEGFNLGNMVTAWWAVCATQTSPGTNGCTEVVLPYTVASGDRVQMLTARVGHCAWKMALRDLTRGWAFSKVFYRYCMPNWAHDAAWALEGGTENAPLMHFKHVRFSHIRYDVAGHSWTHARFTDAEAIYSNNFVNGNRVIVCAIGHAWRDQVIVGWRNSCGA